MIVGSALTIEIGDRTLLADASFVVGAGEKVGLVGRNGTGKSSFISVLVGETAPQLRHRGNVRLLGSFGYLPQAPIRGGLGLEPTGFSHVLSARGLDVLDDALGSARHAMADDPSEENIELFTDLQEQFQSNGGYEAEAVMARLAEGLGLRQELLLEDIDELSGGQRRRVDLMRVLFQEPELMILDEPTNHLDRSAKRWLLDELARFPGALLVVSHDLKLLDQSITKVLHISNERMTEWKGNYSRFQTQHEADQAQRERASELERREITRLSTLADSMRASTEKRAQGQGDRQAGRAAPVGAHASRQAGALQRLQAPDAAAIGRHAARGGEAGHPLRQQRGALRRDLPRRPGRPHRDHRPQRRREVLAAALPGRGASALQRRDRARCERRGGLLRAGTRADRPRPQRAGQRQRRRAESRAGPARALGSFGLPSKAAGQLSSTLSGGERAKLGLAMLAAGEVNLLLLDEPTNNLDPSSITAVGTMLGAWPGTIVAVSHERGFVEALRPTYCLRLPEERFTHWREEYLDDVEMR